MQFSIGGSIIVAVSVKHAILSYIETDCVLGTFKKLCTALLLNSKEDFSN